MTGFLGGRKLARLLLVCCALAANACSGAASGDAPRLHVVRVNENSPEALAGARQYAEAAAESCRAETHLSGGGAPVSDAQLGKIVFFEDEAFYDGDRIAHYTTHRFVVADAGSSCAPYVLVAREVKITDGCSSRIAARSGVDIASVGREAPQATAPETTVESTGQSGDACVSKRKPLDASSVPVDAAGSGANCVWRSRLMSARFGALMKKAPAAGNGPSPTGLDACLYQALPHYASAHSAGEDVVLRTHASTPPAAQFAVSGGHVTFEANTRLKSLETGGAAVAKFDKSAADAFVHLPSREAL